MADHPERRLATDEEILKLPSLARQMPRLTMPLGAMIGSFCERPEIARNRKLMAFFDFVKTRFPDAGYRDIQLEHLSPENVEFMIGSKLPSFEHKYLDLPFWAHSKFSVGSILSLGQHAGQAVLDLGAGPAHFGLVAQHFGCRYLGLDVAQYHWTPATRRHLYDDLCEFFAIDRITQTITPFTPLRLPERYGLVTCLMGTFCSHQPAGKGLRTPWSWKEWAFLLDDLARNVLTPQYTMYFQISRDYLPEEVTANIRTFAKSFDEERSVFTFDQTLDLDALRRSAQADR